MVNNILYKSFEGKAVDIDEKSNTVVVYYAAFGNKDSYKDVIPRGAFAKTIQERGPKAKDLIYHFKNHREAISKPKELIEDDYGLKGVVSFPNSTAGRDTVEEYKFGMWKYHSIGYSTIKEQKKDDYNELQEIKLFEGSHVMFPANDMAVTQMVDLKNYKPDELSQMVLLMKSFIDNAKATDEAIKRIEQQYNDLKTLITEPHNSTQPNIDDIKSIFTDFKNTIK